MGLPYQMVENLRKDASYYSIESMDNMLKCKDDNMYLGDLMIYNERLIWHSIHKYIGAPDVIAKNLLIDKDDILQIGRVGFIKAVNAFDVTRGIRFTSYAVPAIVREIKCYLRDNANLIKPSRKAHSLLGQIKRLEQENNYEQLSSETLSGVLGVPKEQINKALVIGGPVKYLEEMFFTTENASEFNYTDGCLSLEDTVGTEHSQLELVDRLFMEAVLSHFKEALSPAEYSVLLLKLNGMTQASIAQAKGVSVMKISRIMKKIINVAVTHGVLGDLFAEMGVSAPL